VVSRPILDLLRLSAHAEEGLVTLNAEEYRAIAECLGVEPAALATAPDEPQVPPGKGWIDSDRLTPLLSSAFEAFGLNESQAINLALALISASDTPEEEAEQASGLVRAFARSLVKLFPR